MLGSSDSATAATEPLSASSGGTDTVSTPCRPLLTVPVAGAVGDLVVRPARRAHRPRGRATSASVHTTGHSQPGTRPRGATCRGGATGNGWVPAAAGSRPTGAGGACDVGGTHDATAGGRIDRAGEAQRLRGLGVLEALRLVAAGGVVGETRLVAVVVLVHVPILSPTGKSEPHRGRWPRDGLTLGRGDVAGRRRGVTARGLAGPDEVRHRGPPVVRGRVAGGDPEGEHAHHRGTHRPAAEGDEPGCGARGRAGGVEVRVAAGRASGDRRAGSPSGGPARTRRRRTARRGGS